MARGCLLATARERALSQALTGGGTMLGRWIRHLLWRPFELGCRLYPLLPLRAEVTQPVEGVTCIRINNAVTRALSRFGGGYDYAVCYVVDDTLLVDTGFPWARRCLRQTLIGL